MKVIVKKAQDHRAGWQVIPVNANPHDSLIERQVFTTRKEARCYAKHRNNSATFQEASAKYINDI